MEDQISGLFCVTGAALRMTWLHFFAEGAVLYRGGNILKTHLHEAVSFAFHFPFLKEVSQNCFVSEVIQFQH